jgi:hypothetical protein
VDRQNYILTYRLRQFFLNSLHTSGVSNPAWTQSRLQTLPSEQGEVSQRSVLPQQVSPFEDEFPILTEEGVENILCRFLLPQQEQERSISWFNERTKTSVTFPHS